MSSNTDEMMECVAIIGMAGRFPGADSVAEFWQNLRTGVESITFFNDEDLSSVDSALRNNPDYIKASGILNDIESFDASFFGFSPREAEVMDPQHRLFLECAWEAFENAGYDPESYQGLIGIYAGMGMSKYLLNNLLPNRELIDSIGPLQLKILNDKDFLTPLVSYELNLRGPSVTVQTACSTSLVAVSMGCQSLLSYQSDMVVAGGVALEVPHKAGYLSLEGVTSPDGHCRAFDATANGTVGGNGLGLVILKRLSEAIADGDKIHAVIRGSATNNDGANKVGYTATSVDGQVAVIALAQAVAGVEPETINYVEAHGTGTPLGDPIEVAALSQVFSANTDEKNFCAIGSVKTNIGHLDAAAGVAGLIKTTLALEHREIPASLNFSEPNPRIDFENSPFYVNRELAQWDAIDDTPRRAGVSSFSLGGVNAHVILEEAPEYESSGPSRASQLLVLSAKSEAALEQATDRMAVHLKANPKINIADVAYTAQIGRRAFRHRRVIVGHEAGELAQALETRDPKRLLTGECDESSRPIVFMLPGLGNQYVNMGRELYRDERVFREYVDRCCEILKPLLGVDLRQIIYPAGKEELNAAQNGAAIDLRRMLGRAEPEDEATALLNQTIYSQPAVFVVEYALAQWWISCGCEPQALIGYSIGEHVAACLAGVFSLDDALMLVAKRAQLIAELPAGAMLAVPLSEADVKPLLGEKLSLAAVNGAAVCVLAGPVEAINELETSLAAGGVACRRPQTTHAFHSHMMEPISDAFISLCKTIKLNAPRIPYISNVTGTWVTPEQATDSKYWANHLCQPVRFADGIAELWKNPDRVLLEVGPGQALGAWALQQAPAGSNRACVLASLRHSYDRQRDIDFLLNSIGRLWLAGVQPSWAGFYAGERRRRVELPTYPFERQRYWIDPPAQAAQTDQQSTRPATELKKRSDLDQWFYIPTWKETAPLPLESIDETRSWLIFADECGISTELATRLGTRVTVVRAGESFEQTDEREYTIDPRQQECYRRLFEDLSLRGESPNAIAHLWNVTSEEKSADEHQWRGFYSLMFIAQVLGEQNFTEKLALTVFTNGAHQVSGEEDLCPAKATITGPCKVIPREYPHVTCRTIDIVIPKRAAERARLLERLTAELAAPAIEQTIAYRGSRRWEQQFEQVPLATENQTLLRDGGVYLITGGAGGIGLTLARHLAQQTRAKLVLTGRTHLPPREEWKNLADENERLAAMLALEELGAEVVYFNADVTSRLDMSRVIQQTVERFGTLNGVIHAAGEFPGGMMQLKPVQTAAAVLAPKVNGTLVIEEVTKDLELDFLLLCSSLTAVLGGFGMVDHCAANAFLDAYARERQQRDLSCMTLSLNWDTWLEVGQAARAGSPLAQGKASKPQGEALDHPLLTRRQSVTPEEEVVVTEFATSKHWVLDEHRMMGNGMLPGTAYMEMVRAAFAPHAENAIVEVEKALFLAPLIVSNGETKEARTVLRRNRDAFEFQVVSGTTPDVHMSGRVVAAPAEEPTQYDVEALKERCGKSLMSFNGDGQGRTRAHQDQMVFGPRWDGLLKHVHAGTGEWLAYLELPEQFTSDLGEFVLHPSLLDAATGVVQLVDDKTYLPMGYDKLRAIRPLTRQIYSYVRHDSAGSQNGLLTCDVTILDQHGNQLVEIEGYTLKMIDEAMVQSLSQLQGTQTQPAQTTTSATQNDNDGMTPAEGVQIFTRVLTHAHQQPQLITSTKEIHGAIEFVRSFTRDQIMREMKRTYTPGVKHPRPNVQNAYVAPRNEPEMQIAEVWQDMLGIDQVGCFDNFFELGGDSLLATQLISHLGDMFQIELPLRALFEAPTVADLAVSIVQKQAEQMDSESLAAILAELGEAEALANP